MMKEILGRMKSVFKAIREFIQIEYDLAFKISVIVSFLLSGLAYVVNLILPAVSMFFWIFMIMVVQLFFLLQYVEGIDEDHIENRRFYMFIVFLLSTELIFLSFGLVALFGEILLFVAFYAICAISLNLSTGLVGVLNFGLIFQVAIGAITYGIVTVNFGGSILLGIFIAILVTAGVSALIALTTLRLQDDYFAIVSITLGEIFRRFLKTEPSLRGPLREDGSDPTTPGIIDVPSPLKDFFDNYVLGVLGWNVQYRFFLALLAIGLLIIVYFIAQYIIYSPYGRMLRSIREDDLVVSTYGKDVLLHKVQVLAVSGAVAALGGVVFSWIFVSLFPENFLPLTTFYVWTVYIIGGRGNNKGMISGAIAFVLLQRLSLFYDDPTSWIFVFLNFTVKLIYPPAPDVLLAYLQLTIVGVVLILFIRYAPRGLIPETAYRPLVKGERLPPPGSQVDLEEDNE